LKEYYGKEGIDSLKNHYGILDSGNNDATPNDTTPNNTTPNSTPTPENQGNTYNILDIEDLFKEDGGSTLIGSLKPQVSLTKEGNAYTMISTILGVLQVLSVCAVVVSIALIGFNTMLGSANEKALNQEKFVGILVAAALIFGGSYIAQLIISVVQSI